MIEENTYSTIHGIFRSELALRDYLYSNPVVLVELIGPISKIEKEHSTSVGFIDLLITLKNGGLVVVEIKNQKASDKVIGQTLRYMGAIKKSKGIQPKGLILAPEYDDKLWFSASQCPNIDVLYLGIKIKLFSKSNDLKVNSLNHATQTQPHQAAKIPNNTGRMRGANLPRIKSRRGAYRNKNGKLVIEHVSSRGKSEWTKKRLGSNLRSYRSQYDKNPSDTLADWIRYCEERKQEFEDFNR